MRKVLLSALATALAVPSPVSAEDIIDPGRLVEVSPSTRAFEPAYDSIAQCKASMSVPGGLTIKQRKAYVNVRNNACYCVANQIGELWDGYGQDDLSTGMALMRGEAETQVCIDKYVTPYIVE